MDINWPELVQVVLSWLGGVGLVGAGGAFVRTKYKQLKAVNEAVGPDAVKEAWKDLALAREQKIEDMDKEIQALESRISKLEGAYEALQALKEGTIADRVVELLIATGQTRS